MKRLLVLVPVAFALGCGLNPGAKAQSAAMNCPNPAGGAALPCTLTFADNFDKGVLDRTKWSDSYVMTQTWGTDRPVWAPDAFDFLASTTAPNTAIRLRMDARQTNFPDGWQGSCDSKGQNCTYCKPSATVTCTKSYTAAAMTTYGSFYQAYGYFEASMRMAAGPGMFPAFWGYSQDNAYSSEIDAVEGNNLDVVNETKSWLDWNWFYGKHQDIITGPTYPEEYDFLTASGGQPVWSANFDPTAGFHTYAMAWTPDNIQFYVDGNPIAPQPQINQGNGNVPSDPIYLLLDADLGGPGGAPSASTKWPAYLDVAHVYAYQYSSLVDSPAASALHVAMVNPPVTNANPLLNTYSRPTIAPQTVNPGDTLTVANVRVLNNSGSTLYSSISANGNGPHFSVHMYGFNGNPLVSTTSSALAMQVGYDYPAGGMPNGAGVTLPIPANSAGFTMKVPTNLQPGVYGLEMTTSYTTVAGGVATGSPNLPVGNALSRFTVLPSTYPILNLNAAPLVFSPTPGKSSLGSWAISGTGNTSLAITGDSAGDALSLWLTAPYAFNVTPSTMLEFDFSSTDAADASVYSLGLFPADTSAEFSEANCDLYLFQLAGSRALGQQSFKHYANGDGTTHYMIPVGDYYQGAMTNLTITASGTTNATNATFSNIRFYDLSPDGVLTQY